MRRFWQSDLMVSWGAFGVRLVSVAVVLPAILIALPAAEAALWLFLNLMLGFATVIAFGLQPTFTRQVAYAMAGEEGGDVPDAARLGRIAATLRAAGLLAAGVAALLYLAGGSLAGARLVAALEAPGAGRAALVLTALTGTAVVWGQAPMAWVLGTGRVLALRRWELVTGLGQALSLLAVVLAGGGFLVLVLVYNFWLLAGVLRNAAMARGSGPAGLYAAAGRAPDRAVLARAWPAQWRLGLSVLSTLGLMQLSGVAAAQTGTPEEVASYLFHLRLVLLVAAFAQPAFYNRIPEMARAWAAGDRAGLAALVRRRMALAYWSFAVAFAGAMGAGWWFIEEVTTAGYSFSPALFGAFGLAFFAERYVGMHGQVVMLSNRVPYGLNLAAAAVAVAAAAALVPALGPVGYPLAYLSGLALAFAPFVARLSYRLGGFAFPRFELATALGPLLAISAVVLAMARL